MATFIDINKQKKNKIIFKKPGEYVAFLHNLSQEVTFDIQSEGVDLQIYGIYIGWDTDSYDLTSTQLHSYPNSTSNLFIKGVFFDESRFLYKGLIRIEKKASGSKAHQKNQNLKMSSKAFVESDPFLEILNNDVSCGHGSSTGQLDKEQMHYLHSRGLNHEQAQKLLIDGFLNEVVEQVKEKVPSFKFSI